MSTPFAGISTSFADHVSLYGVPGVSVSPPFGHCTETVGGAFPSNHRTALESTSRRAGSVPSRYFTPLYRTREAAAQSDRTAAPWPPLWNVNATVARFRGLIASGELPAKARGTEAHVPEIGSPATPRIVVAPAASATKFAWRTF